MTKSAVGDAVVALTFTLGSVIAVVAAVEDARTGRLRNVLTATTALGGVAGFGLAAVVTGDGVQAVGSLLGAALFAGPWFVMYLLRPAGIGFGDVKLTAGLGLYLGWIDPVLSAVAVVAATGLFVAETLVWRPVSQGPRPFGPALVGGAFLAAIAGLVLMPNVG